MTPFLGFLCELCEQGLRFLIVVTLRALTQEHTTTGAQLQCGSGAPAVRRKRDPQGLEDDSMGPVPGRPSAGGTGGVELGLGCGASRAEGLPAGRLCEGGLSKAGAPRGLLGSAGKREVREGGSRYRRPGDPAGGLM